MPRLSSRRPGFGLELRPDDGGVRVEVRVDHALDAEAGDRLDRESRRDRELSALPTAAIAALDVADEEAGRPVVDQLGHRAASKAITGVPQAIASTTLYPNGSSNPIRWSNASAPPSSSERSARLTGPTNDTRVPVDPGSDELVEVLLILDDPGDHERQPGTRAATSIASTVPLSGWIRPKKSR